MFATLAGATAFTGPGDGSITLSYGPWAGTSYRLDVDPDGRVKMRDSRGDNEVRMDPDFYRRFADLVEPMRRYAGGTMPCADAVGPPISQRNPLGVPKPMMATLRWVRTGQTVRLKLACMQGPPALAKLRDAIDLIKRLPDDVEAPPSGTVVITSDPHD